MGLPFWRPPEGTSYLATYGASRASATPPPNCSGWPPPNDLSVILGVPAASGGHGLPVTLIRPPDTLIHAAWLPRPCCSSVMPLSLS